MTQIEDYSYSLTDNGEMELWVTLSNGQERIECVIADCGKMTDTELNNLAIEILEQNNYVFRG